MTTLRLTASLSDLNAEVLVLAASRARQADGTPTLLTDGAVSQGLDLVALTRVLPVLGFTGALDAVVRVPASILGPQTGAASVLVVGTGIDPDAATGDTIALGGARFGALRRAAGRAARELAGTGSAAFLLPATDRQDLVAVAEGALVGAYSWNGLPTTAHAAAPVPALEQVIIVSPAADDGQTMKETVLRATALAEATTLVRDLVNEPPNRLTPLDLAARSRRIAADAGLEVEVIEAGLLAERGYGGIVGVGQGSVHPPLLVRVTWAPQEPARRVALVGKGITFDSGGLSLKPAASMPEMKSDMAGAATALAVVLAAARMGLRSQVDAWLPLAENMPTTDAQRPGDIVTMYNGTTVEITNTDAEGRLVMADALARAVEDEPDCVLDMATLTGAQIVALGDRVAGVMGSPGLRDDVARCAARAGEAFWPMPLPEHLRSALDSPFASLRNAAVGDRAGGMLVAGLFLREFVGNVPWAHLDIAGPAYNDKSSWGATPVGGTGFGVATVLEFLRSDS